MLYNNFTVAVSECLTYFLECVLSPLKFVSVVLKHLLLNAWKHYEIIIILLWYYYSRTKFTHNTCKQNRLLFFTYVKKSLHIRELDFTHPFLVNANALP